MRLMDEENGIKSAVDIKRLYFNINARVYSLVTCVVRQYTKYSSILYYFCYNVEYNQNLCFTVHPNIISDPQVESIHGLLNCGHKTPQLK